MQRRPEKKKVHRTPHFFNMGAYGRQMPLYECLYKDLGLSLLMSGNLLMDGSNVM